MYTYKIQRSKQQRACIVCVASHPFKAISGQTVASQQVKAQSSVRHQRIRGCGRGVYGSYRGRKRPFVMTANGIEGEPVDRYNIRTIDPKSQSIFLHGSRCVT